MSYRWNHSDPDLAAQAEAGMVRAADGAWDDTSARQLRALIVRSCHNQARLAGSVGLTGATLELDLLPLGEAAAAVTDYFQRWSAARALAQTWTTLAYRDHYDAASVPLEVYSQEGLPHGGEVAGIPVAVAVVGIVAGSAALCYLGYRTLDVVDRQLARNAANRALLQKHAAAELLVEQHLDREEAAGKPLPLDDATKTVLDQLGELQEQATPEAPPVAEPSGTEWTAGAWALGLAAAAAVAAWFGPQMISAFSK